MTGIVCSASKVSMGNAAMLGSVAWLGEGLESPASAKCLAVLGRRFYLLSLCSHSSTINKTDSNVLTPTS